MALTPENRFKRKEETPASVEKTDAYSGFSGTDRAIADQNPEYGEQLSQLKQNYKDAQTDEERKGWHDEAEKLSNAYGYTRSADGSRVTRLESNLETIRNFDKAYGKDDANGYQSVINALLGDIAGAKFKYDAKSDPRYALAQDYAEDAMKNQMAESAALTGGYGNSYASAVGQQVYGDYMEGAVDNLEDRAYSRFRDEQSDRYQRLNTLIGLENTAYDRALDRENTAYSRDAETKSDARSRVQSMLENGSAPGDIPAELRAASGLTDAEISSIYNGVQSSLYASGTAAARERVDAYIQNGGDPSKLSQELLAQSGYTDAEIEAARDSVLENIRQQRYKVYGGSTGGANGTDSAEEPDGDALGLFTAAAAAAEDGDGEKATKDYITKNYKAYGFSSASGLQKRYADEFVESANVLDMPQADAYAYLAEFGIPTKSIVTRDAFYSAGKRVAGTLYDSYYDYIQALADGAQRKNESDLTTDAMRKDKFRGA